MKAQHTMEFIGRLFNDLTSSQKVEMMAVLYYDLRDSEKDKFLQETENS